MGRPLGRTRGSRADAVLATAVLRLSPLSGAWVSYMIQRTHAPDSGLGVHGATAVVRERRRRRTRSGCAAVVGG